MAVSQKPNKGLQAHVGVYTAGVLPLELLQNVQPIVQVDHFMQPPEFLVSAIQTPAASGQALTIGQVPIGEFWRVIHIGFKTDNTVLGATRSITWQLGFTTPDGFGGGGFDIPRPISGNDQQFVSSLNNWGGVSLPPDWFAPALTQFYIVFPTVAGTGTIPGFYGTMLIQRFKI